ncbi:Cro/Cl family transcriptional regulator [Oenococcus oeni]|nr:Cro/Cl family transcriptional regulator [Oenococcus oeni]TEU59064.1 Cro/Cl family transcriptional regulator [Oenococcus oeni]TEU59299.1 Cro/Cl family transcriptional regulator [Oenococcus oeni]
MSVSYEPLWKKLREDKLNKTRFRDLVGISNGTLSKLSNNEEVNLKII